MDIQKESERNEISKAVQEMMEQVFEIAVSGVSKNSSTSIGKRKTQSRIEVASTCKKPRVSQKDFGENASDFGTQKVASKSLSFEQLKPEKCAKPPRENPKPKECADTPRKRLTKKVASCKPRKSAGAKKAKPTTCAKKAKPKKKVKCTEVSSEATPKEEGVDYSNFKPSPSMNEFYEELIQVKLPKPCTPKNVKPSESLISFFSGLDVITVEEAKALTSELVKKSRKKN